MDEGENAEIEYAIIDGNDNRIFAISRGEQNQGLLTVERRLDREEAGVYLLTIKCFRPYEKKLKSQVSKYNSVVSFFPRFFFFFLRFELLTLHSFTIFFEKNIIFCCYFHQKKQDLSLIGSQLSIYINYHLSTYSALKNCYIYDRDCS